MMTPGASEILLSVAAQSLTVPELGEAESGANHPYRSIVRYRT